MGIYKDAAEKQRTENYMENAPFIKYPLYFLKEGLDFFGLGAHQKKVRVPRRKKKWFKLNDFIKILYKYMENLS